MSKFAYIIGMVLLVILLLLALPYLWQLIGIIFVPKRSTLWQQLEMYQWTAIGFGLFAFARRFIKNNITFAETFSHEFTHTFFAIIFNRRVHSFHAEGGSGVVYTSGKNKKSLVPIALAPYCFPIFTYFLLSVRWLMNFHGVWVYDILIGITLCFHFYCFKTQIGNHQTDINQYPLTFSYTYIVTAWIVNLCIILPSFFPNMNGIGHAEPLYHYGVWSSIYRFLGECWNNLVSILHLL